jgi:hypothetical protein
MQLETGSKRKPESKIELFEINQIEQTHATRASEQKWWSPNQISVQLSINNVQKPLHPYLL